MSSSIAQGPSVDQNVINTTVDAQPQATIQANKSTQTKLNTAVQQVKDICSNLSNAVKGRENKTIMGRVAEGFMAVAALGPALAKVGVLFAGKGIDKLVDKHPVLAMAVGVAGLVGGIVLCTHEPFTGIALTTAAAYAILKSYKPVHDKLMAALNKEPRVNKEEDVSIERSSNGADLQNTLFAVNNENINTLVLNGEFSLADFKELPTCPKVTKLVLDIAPNEQSGITQETPLNIAAIFPNLKQIETKQLSDASGKIISEMLATEALKSLKLENVGKQVDTLSGPLHNMASNHLTELVYSEAPNNPRSDALSGFCVDIQLDKLLDTSTNLKRLSLSGHFNLSQPDITLQARCQKVHGMKALTHFEMKNSPNMAEEYLAYMLAESGNLEHINLSNNSQGVGTSFKTLLGQRADDSSKAVLPQLKHLTFWENAMGESTYAMRAGSLGSQVENSLKLLGTHEERLHQLDLKVGDDVSEEAVIQATKSVKHGGKLTLGFSKQVTEQTVSKIKAQRSDIDIIMSHTRGLSH